MHGHRALTDSPGQMLIVTQIIAGEGGNVTSVLHERTNTEISVNACTLRMTIETRNREHIQTIVDKLKAHNIHILSVD